MVTYDKIGNFTVIAAADLADASHAINADGPTQFNGKTNANKVVGRMYLRDNGSNDYDIAIPLETGTTGKWAIVGTGGAVVTPS